jgi:hypothetical protein
MTYFAQRGWFLVGIGSWLALMSGLLVACTASPASSVESDDPYTSAGVLLVDEAIATDNTDEPLAVVGYLFSDPQRTILCHGLSFREDGTPQPLPDAPARHIWLGTTPPPEVAPMLEQHGPLRYGLLQAQGQLEPTSSSGPERFYPYQMREPTYRFIVPQKATIAALATNTSQYDGLLVEVAGVLLVSESSALLVEQVGPGGVPVVGSIQVKVAAPLRDQALVQRLAQNESGAVHFGLVSVTGVWRNRQLEPLAIQLLDE